MTHYGFKQDDDHNAVSRAFPATRISFLYVSDPAKVRITGLYRLLATVEQCLYRASDNQVARAKLVWWLEELRAATYGNGTHPLSLQLRSCGALDAWPEALLTSLFTLALYRVDAAALGTEIELLNLCEAIGSTHLELECALLGHAVPDEPTIKQLSAVNGQIQLLRESFWAKEASFYWVPLTLCAKLNLQRQQINKDSVTKSGCSWIGAVTNLVLEKPHPVPGSSAMEGILGDWSRHNLHWLLFSFLQQRQLQRVAKISGFPRSASNVASLISQIEFLDSWATWRIARQLQTGKWR